MTDRNVGAVRQKLLDPAKQTIADLRARVAQQAAEIATMRQQLKIPHPGRIEKWRAAGDEQPHVEITISTL